MAIKVFVDMDSCQGYGQCCFEAGDFFVLDDNGALTYSAEVDESRRDEVERAADVCPMQAISVE